VLRGRATRVDGESRIVYFASSTRHSMLQESPSSSGQVKPGFQSSGQVQSTLNLLVRAQTVLLVPGHTFPKRGATSTSFAGPRLTIVRHTVSVVPVTSISSSPGTPRAQRLLAVPFGLRMGVATFLCCIGPPTVLSLMPRISTGVLVAQPTRSEARVQMTAI
jgi:hypothetical protein